ncbi:hypothetical protein ACVWZV_003413 [Bradyrhizobium sp. GM5.1]
MRDIEDDGICRRLEQGDLVSSGGLLELFYRGIAIAAGLNEIFTNLLAELGCIGDPVSVKTTDTALKELSADPSQAFNIGDFATCRSPQLKAGRLQPSRSGSQIKPLVLGRMIDNQTFWAVDSRHHIAFWEERHGPHQL